MTGNKKSLLLLTFLIASMMFGYFTAIPPTNAQQPLAGQSLAFWNYYTARDATNLSVFMDWFIAQGGTAKNITTAHISGADLTGVTVLMLNCPDAKQDENVDGVHGWIQADYDAVFNWFTSPGYKFLWLSADSDYSEAVPDIAYKANNASKMLETLGSQLRFEPASIEDPVNNAQGAYRPFINWTTTDPAVSDCVAGVSQVLAHSGTLLYGLDAANNPVALETTALPNVHIIMQTGLNGTINDHTVVTDPMYAHTNGAQGHFVMVAAEFGVAGTSNKLVVSSCAPIGGYAPMYLDEYKTISADGKLFVTQTVLWGVTPYLVPMDMTLILIIGGAIAVIVIVIIIIFLVMRRR